MSLETPLIDQKGRRLKLCCSFCGNSEKEVLAFIASPTALICNECVEVCVNAIVARGVPINVVAVAEPAKSGGGRLL